MDLGIIQRHLENLRIVFLFHFVLTSWAMLYAFSQAYFFYNILFLITLLWGLHSKESDEPIVMGLYINCLSVIFDVIVIIFYHPEHVAFVSFFSVVAALLNLILRFFSIVSLCKLCESRNGTIPPFLHNLIGGAIDREQQSYEDIDRSVPHQSVPQTEVGLEPKITSKPNPKANPKPEKPKSRSNSRSDKSRDDKSRDDKSREDNCPE